MISPAEIEIRKTGIGASEIGAIAGLSPYAGPLDIYLRKLDLIDDETSEAAEWGHVLEPVIADRYARETGATLTTCTTLRHPEHPWILATPDRRAALGADSWLVEVKTASLRVAHRWGDPGTDEVPEEYLAQVTWQMFVEGSRRADVALLLGGQEYRTYSIPFDPELAAALVERGREFWHDHVLTQVPPSQGSVEAARAWLRQRYPIDDRPIRTATVDEIAVLEELRAARSRFDAAEETKQLLEAKVKALIGDAAGLDGGLLGRVTWKKNKDGSKTDWEAVARALSAPADLIAQHTKTTTGARVLRCTFKEA